MSSGERKRNSPNLVQFMDWGLWGVTYGVGFMVEEFFWKKKPQRVIVSYSKPENLHRYIPE